MDLIEQIAIWACRDGHEQERSGQCATCRELGRRSWTDLVRWEASGSTNDAPGVEAPHNQESRS